MDTLPRGPVFDSEGNSPDATDDYTRKLEYWRNSAYEEAVRTRKLCPEEDRVNTYRNFISGNHKIGAGKPRYRSAFYLNKTDKARRDSLALLTDSRPDIEVDARVKEYQPTANAVDLTLRSEWTQQDMDLDLVTVADIASVTGTGFWKVGAASPGMMRISSLGPDCVMPVQPGMHIQQSTLVLCRNWKSLAEVQSKFPARSADIEKEASRMSFAGGSNYAKPDGMMDWTWNGLAPQMQRMLGKRLSTEDTPVHSIFKTVEWQEYWVDDLSINESLQPVVMRDPYMPMEQHNWHYVVQPGQRLYPRKRLIIFAGKKLIYDGPSPYWHGLYPFACLRLNPVFWSFWGLSKYRDLIPVNAAINDIVSGILDMVKKALNPTTIARGQSVSKASWDTFFPDMPGAKLYLQGQNANPQADIQFSKPPDIPPYVGQILTQFLGPEFDKMAGIMDIASLSKKDQVPGGDTIEQMRDSLQTSLRLEGRYIEAFLKDAGIQAVSHIFQFYSGRQRMRLIGPDGFTAQDLDQDFDHLTPANENKFDHWKQYRVSVTPGSLHGGARDRSKMLFMSLHAQGAIDDQALLEKLEIPNAAEIIERKDAKMQAMIEAGAAAKAGGPGQPIRMSRGQRNGAPM